MRVPEGASGISVPSEREVDGALPVEVAKFNCCDGMPVGVGEESDSEIPEKKIDRITTRKPAINRMISTDLFFCKKIMSHL